MAKHLITDISIRSSLTLAKWLMIYSLVVMSNDLVNHDIRSVSQFSLAKRTPFKNRCLFLIKTLSYNIFERELSFLSFIKQ